MSKIPKKIKVSRRINAPKRKSNFRVSLIGGLTVVIICLMVVLNQSTLEAEKPFVEEPTLSASKDVVEILEKNCSSCHGDKKVKGKFNIVEILAGGIQTKDSGKWADVMTQITSGEMPPAKSDFKLTQEERHIILDALNKKLNQKNLSGRLLTPYELQNSISKLLNYNSEEYSSFVNLQNHKNLEARYSTIESGALFSESYFLDLSNELNVALKDKTTAFEPKQQVQPKVLNLGFRQYYKPGAASYLELTKASEVTDKKDGDFINDRELYAKLAQAGEPVHIDIRRRKAHNLYADWQQGPRYENLFPGKYRLTFTATALNRDIVKKAKDKFAADYRKKFKQKKSTSDDNVELEKEFNLQFQSWQQLLFEKSRLGFYKTGKLRHKTAYAFTPNPQVFGHQETKIASVEIDDNIEKKYSLDFELEDFSNINVTFENGPEAKFIQWLKLPTFGRSNTKAYSYNFPSIRISGLFRLERLEEHQPRNKYVANELSEKFIKEKYTQLTEELSLSKESQISNKKASQSNILKKYYSLLKLVIMSPENLYLDPKASRAEMIRFASYSLLKRHPSKDFKEGFLQFLNKQRPAAGIATKVIEAADFRSFLNEFSAQWLKQDVELAPVKHKALLKRHAEFKEETVEYLSYLFANNRPIKELFDSDYKVVNQSLASHYGSKKLDDLKVNAYSKLPLSGKRGGILNQAAFFISQSDGVDPLPFRRAQWILENVFDQHIPEPPNDVDSVVFMNAKETNSFEERIELHAQVKSCNSCHRLLDPIALAINHLDIIGVQSLDIAKNEEAWQKLQAKMDERVMAKAFAKNLLSYIIGRETNVYDLKSVEVILDDAKHSSYGLKDILVGIIDRYLK